MSENALQHLTYGRAIVGDVPEESADILALSDALTTDSLSALRLAASVAPMPLDGLFETQAVSYMPYGNEGDYALARTHYQRAERTMPATQYIVLPREVAAQLVNINDVLGLIDSAIPTSKVFHAPVAPLEAPDTSAWSAEADVQVIEQVLSKHANSDIKLLLATLGAILQTGVIVSNFTMNWRERLTLVRSLMALLPPPLRYRMSFSTYTNDLGGTLPRLVFTGMDYETSYTRIDWGTKTYDAELLEQPYIAHLNTLWDEDLGKLLEHIAAISVYATPQQTLTNLTALTKRHQYDLAVQHHDVIQIDDLMSTLQGDTPPLGELRRQYIERLFHEALAARNSDAAVYLADQFDADEDLNNFAHTVMFERLKNQPDTVYAFVRARLVQGTSDKWLMWLKAAAASSLEIALESGDDTTLANWLTLIGREPLRYELSSVLHEGILGASKAAHNNPELAKQLITLAIKRQPETLDVLLNDEELVTQLSETAQSVLADFNPQAIDSVAPEWREFFLLTLQRALDEKVRCISPTAMRHLWSIQTQNNNNTLPPQYRPVSIIQSVARDGDSLLDGTLETLLTLILRDKEDEFFFEIAPALSESEQLASVMAGVLVQSGRDADAIINIVGTLRRQEHFTAQEAVNTYSAIIGQRTNEDTPLLLEQLGRVLSQYPDATAPQAILWRMMEQSAETKNEQMSRAATRRLLVLFADMVSEESLIEGIQRLRKATNWSQNGKTSLNKWWRDYARQQQLGQLQKLDKALDGHRHLEDLRSVTQTIIAMRRVIGERTLAQFADDVATTFTILQALSEGFDPDGKTTMPVDSTTIRNELTARAEELPHETRHVLATNLKELAQLVTSLAENRSKLAFRNEDAVERQLAKGQQQPQSAIDVMRWLSGYFDGLQAPDEVEE